MRTASSELQQETLADLERSRIAEDAEQRQETFSSFVAGVGELGRRSELDGFGPVTVNPLDLEWMIYDLDDQLTFGNESELYLWRTLNQRSDIQFVLDVTPELPRETILTADGWDEKIRYAWREAEVIPVPKGIPEHHWWWVPRVSQPRFRLVGCHRAS